MNNLNPKKEVAFQQVIDALLDNNKPFSPTYLHRFSDISPEALDELKKAWDQVQPVRRVAVLEDLEELAEKDTLVCFDDLSRFALSDSEPRARAAAIRLLWECSDPKLSAIFIKMLENDPEEIVRAAAASALGAFVYLGELEEINTGAYKKIEEALLKKFKSDDAILVRRRCLESLGYSSSKEILLPIETAFESSDTQWQTSALFAMGRSANNRWRNAVLSKLEDEDEEVRFEAVRAAGELSIAKARRPIMKLLDDPESLEEDLKYAAIWSLSQIGGPKVRNLLESLMDESEDDDECDLLEKALDNLDFNEGMEIPDLLDIDVQDKEEFYKVIDVSHNGEEELDDEDEDDEEEWS